MEILRNNGVDVIVGRENSRIIIIYAHVGVRKEGKWCVR